MHPAYKSDKPGTAPDCGMALEPVYADEAAGGPADTESPLPGSLHISPDKQQLIGVRVMAVARTSATQTLRIPGRVAVDETRMAGISAGDGWVERVYPNSTGTLVRKGDLLASIYSKEFQAAQVSFFYALGSLDKVPREKHEDSGVYVQFQNAMRELRAMGVSEFQIEELTRTHKADTSIELRAPITGFILQRNIVPGMKCDRGVELYRVADLSRIWILADMFENEARHFRPGVKARLTLLGRAGEFQARVSDVLPEFDPSSRTLRVRLEMENPAFALRPGMFVTVELPLALPPVLAVPSDSVLDTGTRKTIFVDRGNGYFEPREVKTGGSRGDQIEVVEGLAEGERVVVSGSFLLDSETRLRNVKLGLRDNVVVDPVCGMKIDPSGAGDLKSVHGGKTFYFCSAGCKTAFESKPGEYLH
jgi:membrane fusion protein, copper/silver efflux system